MDQFIEALPAFGICLVLWIIGFVVLDIKRLQDSLNRRA